MDACPAPTRGPLPCPSTVDQHLRITQTLLPRGEAWEAVFVEGSGLYRFWRAIAATVWWFTEEVCRLVNEFFCSTRDVLRPDYDIEFALPQICNPILDPCMITTRDAMKCEDIIALGAASGWDITSCGPGDRIITSALCAAAGCASASSERSGDLVITVSTGGSPVYSPTNHAGAGLAAAGCSVAGCFPSDTGTIPALHCLLDRFVPAHIGYVLQVVA
jgi:hypothetical protein